jgi:hypothetical protein
MIKIIPAVVDADPPPSLPGLTRQSIAFAKERLFSMDARVKPAHDDRWHYRDRGDFRGA